MLEPFLLKKKAAVAVKTNLLMSFDGDLVDQCGATGITASGYSFKTNQKFGRKAISFSANGGVVIPTTTKLQYAGDFTIEMWMSMSVLTGEQMLFTAGPGMYIDCYTGAGYNGGAPSFLVANRPSNDHVGMIVGNDPFSINTTHHLAFCRLNGTMSLYGDGALLGSIANAVTWGNSNTMVGNYISSALYGFGGGIQELRMSNVCRYTGPFTPPTGPFTID